MACERIHCAGRVEFMHVFTYENSIVSKSNFTDAVSGALSQSLQQCYPKLNAKIPGVNVKGEMVRDQSL